MSDFSPAVRNSAIWSGDARKLAEGKAVEVWLTKTGQKEIEDISDKEPVQWGLHLQDTIGRVAGDRMGLRLKAADYSLTHPKHEWMKSHFDFISEDGKHLVEVKNYSAGSRSKFGDTGSQEVPEGDFAQCLHEAAVHRVERVTLAVLFGGQELCLYPLSFTDASKDVLIQQEADLWARIQTKEPPDPQSADDARALFREDDGSVVIAPDQLAAAVERLRGVKAALKRLESEEDALVGSICSFMREASVLKAADGRQLVTWKQAAGSKRFDTTRFKAEMPRVYEQFQIESPGSRRFLVK